MTLAEAAAELGIKHEPPPLTLSEAHDRTAPDLRDGLCIGVRYPGSATRKGCTFPAEVQCLDCQREQGSVNRRVAAGEEACGWRAQP